MVATADTPHATANPAHDRGSSNDRELPERENHSERRSGDRKRSLPAREQVSSQVPATLSTDQDGALWVTVNGADIQQLAAQIATLCDIFIPAQPAEK